MRHRGLVIAALAVIVPVTAMAESDIGYRGWGPRVGLTVDPDQVHVGFHADFGHFANHVRFQPNFEIGFGDGWTVGAFNAEAAYRFSGEWEAWSPYLGGGIGLNFIGHEDRGFRDRSDTEAGLNLIGGLERGLAGGDRFFTEAKLGLANSPDLKLTVGWTFY